LQKSFEHVRMLVIYWRQKCCNGQNMPDFPPPNDSAMWCSWLKAMCYKMFLLVQIAIHLKLFLNLQI